jgi:hypothetical protein
MHSLVLIRQTYYLLLEISTVKHLELLQAGNLKLIILLSLEDYYLMIRVIRFGNHQFKVISKPFYFH